jgi:tetratricopeptide (TPR) repeat protein
LGTSQAIDQVQRVLAVRIHARSSGDYAKARTYMTEWAGVTWDTGGQPVVPSTWLPDAAVGLADILMQMGERERAGRLIDAVLKSIDDESRVRGRGEFWYLRQLSLLYALLGRDDDALTMLEKCVTQRHLPGLSLYLSDDPAYERLRSQPRFKAVVAQVNGIIAAQRQALDQMRATGVIPHRSRQAAPVAAGATRGH